MRMSGRHSLDLCGPDDGLGAYTIHTYKKTTSAFKKTHS
jgi:hypothetical protein